MLYEKMMSEYTEAFKARDTMKKTVLSYVLAQIKNKKIELQKEPEDADIAALIKKEIKSRQEALVFLEQAHKDAEKTEEEAIIAYLSSYLPTLMLHDELTALVKKVIADQGITDIAKQRGEIVKVIMAEHKAVVDGKMLQDVIMWIAG
jgi:uncharacterized protein